MNKELGAKVMILSAEIERVQREGMNATGAKNK